MVAVPTTDQSIDAAVHLHVEDVLAAYLSERRSELPELAATFARAVDHLTDFALRGGKRLRPTFAWWGWRAAGGDADGPLARTVLRTVSALELIQACALVHDDIMDASELRRGHPTVHVRFTEAHRAGGWLGEPERFGAAAAILLGDLALAWADDLFESAALEPAMRAAAREPWQAMRAEMFAGQYLDVLAQAEGDESQERALGVARLKTAAYTVERPLHLGVALAGADQGVVDAVRAFGTDLGVAFQLRDDVLGVYGDTEVTGKPAGDDLREGKRTLLVAIGLAYAERDGRHADAQLLRGALGDPDLTPRTIEQVRELMVEVGAVAELERRIERLTSSALAALDTAGLAEPGVTRLAELAVTATRRDR
ncbi:geranylgeranyl pyrophosphate synthase [Actinophytocola xinjiangensis]|uniref:Geranylgeranyl pyrophosphate synthase n=1 Tax=Actinophytocola xinjiangensis TaxID=485602 RepID=A0A7Z1AX28_9PSEU|nr:geranylgeranyl pyrophosphate synthase [Actinophytocola xinjiangensis]